MLCSGFSTSCFRLTLQYNIFPLPWLLLLRACFWHYLPPLLHYGLDLLPPNPQFSHTISLAELSFSLEGLHTLFSSEPIRNCLKLSFRKNPAFKSLISSEIVPKQLKILIDFLRDLVESFKPINLISLTLISSFRCVFLETKTHSQVKSRNQEHPENSLVLQVGDQHAKAYAVQSLSHVLFFVTPRTAEFQAPLSFTISRSLLKFISIELAILSNQLILCHPLLLCLQSSPVSGSFPMSQLFKSGGQSIGASASASVLPVNIQGGFPLGLTGFIQLSKRLSRVSTTTI